MGAGAGVAPFRGFWDELRKGPQVAPAAGQHAFVGFQEEGLGFKT